MRFEAFVARRYLRRPTTSKFLSFMTFIAIGSVAVGSAALIITFTILDGFEREIRTNIIGFASHIQVGTFRNQTVEDSPEARSLLTSVKGVGAVSPFFQKEAVLITGDNIDGVMIKGVPDTASLGRMRSKVTEGALSFDGPDGKPGIMVGARLARRMGLAVGDRIVIVSVTDVQRVAAAPKVQFAITGIYETGMSEFFDDVFVFAALPQVQRLLAAPATINGYDVLTTNIDQVETITEGIQDRMGYPYFPKSVFTIYRNLFVWIELQQELIPIVVGSLIVISVFNVIATLLLYVIERTREIGVFASLGATRRQIKNVFVTQGLVIGIVGALAGCIIAFALCFAQQELHFFRLPDNVYYMTTVPIFMRAEVFAGTALVAVALSLLSSIVPAWLASRLDPIVSIRFY